MTSYLTDFSARLQGDPITYETVGMDVTTVLQRVWFDEQRNAFVVGDELPDECSGFIKPQANTQKAQLGCQVHCDLTRIGIVLL